MKRHRTLLLAIACALFGVALANFGGLSRATAQQAEAPEGQRFEISAFTGQDHTTRFGAYVIDSTTGKVWLIREGESGSTVVGKLQ